MQSSRRASSTPPSPTRRFNGADLAFLDAMTTGFWISVGFIAVGLAASLFLLPKKVRLTQVTLDDEDLEAALVL